MKKRIIIFLIILSSFTLKAQINYNKLYISDIKTVEILYKIVKNDCEENKPLFEPQSNNKRKSLFITLLEGLKNNKISHTGFSVINSYPEPGIGISRYKINDILEMMGIDSTENMVNYNTGDISSFLIKEAVFYKHNNSVLQTRTIAICPILEIDTSLFKKNKRPLFWIYLPEIKKLKFSKQINETLFNQKYKAVIHFKYIDNTVFNSKNNENINNVLYSNIIYDIPDNNFSYQYKTYDISQISSIKTITKRIWKDSLKNFVLFYPEVQKNGYKNLSDIILDGIIKENLSPFSSDKLKSIHTKNELYARMGAGIDTTYDINPETGETIPIKTIKNYDSAEITSYLVKQTYYYDINNNLLQTRITAICPVRAYYRNDDLDQEDCKYKRVCWINYDELRHFLVKQNTIKKNRKDKNTTFDNILTNQSYAANYYTSSYISPKKESVNVSLTNKFEDNKFEDNKFEYPFISYNQIKKCKYVFKRIEKEKNPELFYNNENYPSFAKIIIPEIINNNLQTSKADNNEINKKFETKLTIDEVEMNLGVRVDTIYDIDSKTGELIPIISKQIPDFNEIRSYIIKLIYFYDSDNLIQTRAIGIAPVRTWYKAYDLEQEDPIETVVCWIDFAELRNKIIKQYIYPEFNLKSKTFNEYFFRKEYTGEIIDEIEIPKKEIIKLLKTF